MLLFGSLDIACRAALAVLFGVAGLAKIRSRGSRDEFRLGLVGFGVAGPGALAAAALAVPLLELAAAGLLGGLPRGGYLLSLALLVGFSAAIARVLLRKQVVACRCFGASRTPVGRVHLVRNGILILVAAIGAGSHALASPAPAWWLAAAAGALLGALMTRWDDLVFLFGPAARSAPALARRSTR